MYNVGTFENPVYLIGSNNNWILIEGGISAQFASVKDKLCSIVGDLVKIKHWFILHAHYDHCGLLSYLYPHLLDVRVYAGKQACENFKKQKSIHVIESINESVVLLKNNFHTLEKQEKIELSQIPVKPLLDGDIISCDTEHSFLIIETPGHSDCSISILDNNTGRLFASDALGEFFSPKEWFPLAFSDITLYINSIKVLQSTSPKYIALGHSECLDGTAAKEAFNYSLLNTHQIIEDVQKQLKAVNEKAVIQSLHQKYAYNSQGFVPENLHYLSMKRLVNLIQDF